MAIDLERSARAAGAHRWAENRMFEILGGWVASTPEPEAKLLLDRHSQHHAWRALQWWDRLPVLADVDRDALCVAPEGPAAPALDALAGVEGTAGRLAGAYRVVLPRMWTDYRRHGTLADPVADGSTLRTLAIVGADLATDWREGEAVLQELIGGGGDAGPAVRAAADAAGRIEAALVGAAAGRIG